MAFVGTVVNGTCFATAETPGVVTSHAAMCGHAGGVRQRDAGRHAAPADGGPARDSKAPADAADPRRRRPHRRRRHVPVRIMGDFVSQRHVGVCSSERVQLMVTVQAWRLHVCRLERGVCHMTCATPCPPVVYLYMLAWHVDVARLFDKETRGVACQFTGLTAPTGGCAGCSSTGASWAWSW